MGRTKEIQGAAIFLASGVELSGNAVDGGWTSSEDNQVISISWLPFSHSFM